MAKSPVKKPRASQGHQHQENEMTDASKGTGPKERELREPSAHNSKLVFHGVTQAGASRNTEQAAVNIHQLETALKKKKKKKKKEKVKYSRRTGRKKGQSRGDKKKLPETRPEGQPDTKYDRQIKQDKVQVTIKKS